MTGVGTLPEVLHRWGAWSAGAQPHPGRGAVRVLHDPSTGGPLAEVADASAEDVTAAVTAAAGAFDAWSVTPPQERGDRLAALADAVADAAEELAFAESTVAGKPLARARGEIGFAVRVLRYYAGVPLLPTGDVNPSAGDTLAWSVRVPAGVCAAIAPSNYPLLLGVWKVAAALAHGDTVVLKPAERTPLTAMRLAELATAAGLPLGALSVVTGGPDVGRQLCADPRVRVVSFTGSTAAGRDVAATCAAGVKPVALELGGKSPFIVFPDADLDRVVDTVVEAFAGNSGQVCVAGTRLLVDARIADELAERVATAAAALRVGPAMDPATALGPMVSAEATARVEGYVSGALAADARRVGPSTAMPGGDGFYVAPVVLDRVHPGMPVVREEVFGPVLSVLPFHTEAEALTAAHDTTYGLAASVWTSDLGRAHRFARDLRAGMVWVNTFGDTEAHISAGGLGLSGYGRELGIHSREIYTVLRSVWMHHG